MFTEKYVLVKEMLTNRLNTGLQLRVWVEKSIHEVETHWLSGKEKVLGEAVSTEDHAISISWDMKGPITIEFLEKGATVKSAFSCQLLRQNYCYLLNDPGIPPE